MKKRILHIVTRDPDECAAEVMNAQVKEPAYTVRRIDLAPEGADYAALVDEIFRAESVCVW